MKLMKHCRFAVGVAALIVAAALLAGCPAATPKKAAEPETKPEPAPLPGLQGTWRATFADWDDDEIIGTFIDTLTFTSERYIIHRSHYNKDGSFDHRWTHSGTWAESGGKIQRIWVDDGESFMVNKDYHWGASRDVLFIQHWADEEPRRGPEFDRFERVTFDATGLLGEWRWDRTDEEEDDIRIFEFTITADRLTFRFNPYSDTERARTITHPYAYMFDPSTYYLLVYNPNDPDSLSDPDSLRRFAIAPTDKSPNQIVMSVYWDEMDEEYGGYWLHLNRVN